MNLYNFSFLVFLSVLLIILHIIRNLKKECKLLIMLFFSYAFLFFYSYKFVLYSIFVTVIIYLSGLYLDRQKKYHILVISISILILLLVYFKYSQFIVDNFLVLFGHDKISLNIVVPVGISFYTFSAISYIIDVYRRTISAEKNFIFLALYISFFPKIIAGPIVRYDEFYDQIKKYSGIKIISFKEGIQIFFWGFFKKLVLADHINVFVRDVYSAPSAYHFMTIILAVFSYSLQIYYDFSGYSDMAIGVAKIIGFNFSPNFNLPYISKNISEFWKRWHISLSSWFRDYVYIPLGGSKKGELITYINLMITMLLSGLWHGAGWTFIFWGFIHGLYSVIYKKFNNIFRKIGNFTNTVITFLCVTFAWIPFRSSGINNCFNILKGIFTFQTGIHYYYFWSIFTIFFYIISHLVCLYKSNKGNLEKNANEFQITSFYPIVDLSKFRNLIGFIVFIGVTIILAYFGNTSFIYGTF